MSALEDLARLFGVSRLPVPRTGIAIRDVANGLPPGFTLDADQVSVRFDLDIDEAGAVTNAAAAPAITLPPGVHVTAIMGDGAVEAPVAEPLAPVRDAVLAAARRLRFHPAERDGRPVAFRGLRMSVTYSREELRNAAAT